MPKKIMPLLTNNQQSHIDALNVYKLAWMFESEFPKNYQHRHDTPYWVYQLFPDNNAPLLLRGSRKNMWFNDRNAIDTIFDRAVRRLKITIFSSDFAEKGANKAAKYRVEMYENFIQAFVSKFFKSYPSQRVDITFWYSINIINGERKYSFSRDLEKDKEDADNYYLALMMSEKALKKINELEKVIKNANDT